MMQELFGKDFKPKDHYDLIAGTSVGALIAGCYAKGYTVGDVMGFFDEWLPKIFSRSWLFWKSKYSDDGVNEFLKEKIENYEFSQIDVDLIITAYSTGIDKGIYFKTSTPSLIHLKLRDAMRASMAAPTYFPAWQIDINGRDIYVDGGLTGNNDPSSVAFTEAIKFLRWKKDKIKMDSFGCGWYEKKKKPGFPLWIVSRVERIINAFMKTATDNVEQAMKANCEIMSNFSYMRYNPQIQKDYELDDLSEVSEMKKIAVEYIRNLKNKTMDKHKF